MEAKNIKEIVDSLYSSFLARDFFAKVVPGSVVLYAISHALFRDGIRIDQTRDIDIAVFSHR